MRSYDKYLDVITNEEKMIADITGETVRFTDGTAMKNPLCYRFLGNDTSEPVPENVCAKDGKLIINGKEIQTGSLYISDIVVRLSGNVIVTVKAKEEESFLELRCYNLAKDRFFKISDPLSTFTSVDVVWQKGNMWLAHMIIKRPFSIEDEETGEKKEGIQIHDLAAIYNGYSVMETADSIKLGHLIGTVAKTDRDTVVFTSTENLVPFDNSNYVVPENCGNTFVTELVIHVPDPDTEDDVPDVEIYTKTFLGEVKQIDISNIDNRSLLLVGDKSFAYTNNGHSMKIAPGDEAVKAARTYPHVVRLIVSDKAPNLTKFILSNEQYETVTVAVDRTHDRGYVVDIQPTREVSFPVIE